MILTILLSLVAAAAVAAVAEAAWRLRNDRPAKYLGAPGELVVAALLLTVSIVAFPNVGIVTTIAKAVAAGGWATSGVLRAIASRRFLQHA